MKKSSHKRRPSKLTISIASNIESRLQQTWYPEQIAGAELTGKLSVKTIYNWLHRGLLNVGVTVLRRKGRPPRTQEKRGRFVVGRRIQDRPHEINTREVFGHWDVDTLVSSRGKSKGCFATFVEKKTRFYVAIPMEDRTKESMFHAIRLLHTAFTNKVLKSFTTDRGKEFACNEEVERLLGILMYFDDAYFAWQQGSKENSNGLLREFFPKINRYS